MTEIDKQPVKETNERTCQDVVMLVLFALFWIGELVVIGIGFSEGNPDRVVYPMDYKGQLCGVSEAVKDCKYVAWIEPEDVEGFLKEEAIDVCVPACAGNTTDTPFNFQCYPGHDFGSQVMPSDKEYFRRCIPTKLSAEVKSHLSLISNQKLFADLKASFGIIILCVTFSVILSFIWLWLIKRWASEMIWASVIALIAIGVAFLVYLYQQSEKDVEVGNSESAESFQIAAIIFTICFAIILCVLVYMRKRISMTGELMEEAAASVDAMPLLLLFPLFPLFLMVLFFILWFFAAIFIISSGQIDPQGDQRVVMDNRAQNMFGFHVFALIWNLLFIVALQDTTVAGAVATWYYSRDKSNLSSPISTSLSRTLKFNAGSVAFGSLLIAVVKIISVLFEALKKSSQKANSESKFGQFFGSCASWLVRCFEQFIAFITRNALIHVAIYNTSFCQGAKESFKMIVGNMEKIVAVNTVGDFFLFICKISVSAFSSLLCVVILENHFPEVENRAAPAFIVFLLSYIVGCNFFGTIEMAIDTILICFCHEEEEIQKNSSYRPYMSDDLKQFIESSQTLRAKVGDEEKK